jgi:hypothetical protein
MPAAVMLGHLSGSRNTPPLAEAEVRACLRGCPGADLPILVAPRDRPSEVVTIRGAREAGGASDPSADAADAATGVSEASSAA